MLLVFGAPDQLRSLAGQEHGRTIPLADASAGDFRGSFWRGKLTLIQQIFTEPNSEQTIESRAAGDLTARNLPRMVERMVLLL